MCKMTQHGPDSRAPLRLDPHDLLGFGARACASAQGKGGQLTWKCRWYGASWDESWEMKRELDPFHPLRG